MEKLSISEVQIIPLKPRNGLVAIATMVVNDCIYMGQMRIMANRSGGFRVEFPCREDLKREVRRSFQIYHPINAEAKELIESTIIEKFYAVTGYNKDQPFFTEE